MAQHLSDDEDLAGPNSCGKSGNSADIDDEAGEGIGAGEVGPP